MPPTLARSRGLWILIGAALACAGAEAAARTAGRAALNAFQTDAALGVTLVPGAQVRLTPGIDVTVNADGRRGAAWPADRTDAIAIVGDAQVFGPRVAEADTVSAALAARTGRTVLNAGVPTWGPPEYLRAAGALRGERPVGAVVVVLDLAGDAAERTQPDGKRTRVVAGRAVPVSVAPPVPEALERALGGSYAFDVLRARLWPDPAAPQQEPPPFRPRPPGVSEADIAGTYTDAAQARRDNAARLADAVRTLALPAGPDDAARVTTWLEAHLDDPRAAGLRHTLAMYQRAGDQLRALATRVGDPPPPVSPFDDWLGQLVEAVGRDALTVAVLPGPRAGDAAEVVADARTRGLRAVDGSAIPRGPDGLLDAAGNAALAAAVADVLAAPPPERAPEPGFPRGRSRVPTAAERSLERPFGGAGDGWQGCDARWIREWMWLDCAVPDGTRARRVAGTLETWSAAAAGHVQVLSPMTPGHPLEVALEGPGFARRLTVFWQRTTATLILKQEVASPAASPAPAASPGRCDAALAGRPADPTRGCEALPGDCDAVAACATGTRSPLPACGAGQVNAGAAGLCYARCDDAPCAEGTCTEWMGVRACL